MVSGHFHHRPKVAKFYQIKRILKLWRVVVFVGDKNGDLDVGMEGRLAEVVGPDGQVEPAAVAVPLGGHLVPTVSNFFPGMEQRTFRNVKNGRESTVNRAVDGGIYPG